MRREVKTLEDIRAAFEIYQSNSYYFQATHNRDARESDVLEDIEEYPKDIILIQKHYELLLVAEEAVGVIDYLENFPEGKTVYVGIYMIHSKYHRQSLGKNLFKELEKEFFQKGFQKIRLAVVLEN